MGFERRLLLLVAVLLPMILPDASSAQPTATQFVTGLQGGSGSTIGPGGALFVTESAVGTISRIDPRTGDVTTFASGLPPLNHWPLCTA